MGMNVAIVRGNLGGDPEMKETRNGKTMCTFNMAFNFNGEETGWLRVVCFGKLAEIVADNLSKGDTVTVNGELQVSTYDDKDGNRRTSVGIKAYNVDFIKVSKFSKGGSGGGDRRPSNDDRDNRGSGGGRQERFDEENKDEDPWA